MRVDHIRETYYAVTNTATGRQTTFRSPQKFRREATARPTTPFKPHAPVQPPVVTSTAVTVVQPHVPIGLASRFTARTGNPDTAPHLVVEARAGTGKTTTLVEGLKRVKGLPSALTPSPQQKAIWDCMELSRGKVNTICFVAFSKPIALELYSRVPQGCDAMTMHSMGLKAITAACGRLEVTDYRVQDIISDIMGLDIRELRKHKLGMIKATEDLVRLCKLNLTSPVNSDELDKLASHYDVELIGSRNEIYDLVPKVLERCKDTDKDRRIDFNDMIWLPVVLNLPVFRHDLLLIDERQDLNKCQMQLALKAGKRIIAVGDEKQAIYGFAGADASACANFAELLRSHNGRGLVELPLTVTRRCGKAVVEEARKIVPDFEAFETNPEGTITRSTFDPINGYHTLVQAGDFILCRVNAPLVSQCFRFLKAGRRANIQGRDIGQGVISLIKNLHAYDLPSLIGKLTDWHHAEQQKELAKRMPNESRLIALQDKYDCLMCFCDAVSTIEELTAKVEQIFTDIKDGTGIRLSSIHKAKGLEAKRVFLLQPKGGTVPHPMAKSKMQKGQEMNLLYVGITRAIEELVYVSGEIESKSIGLNRASQDTGPLVP